MKAVFLLLALLGAGLAWAALGGRDGSVPLAEVEEVEPTSFEAGPSGSAPAATEAVTAGPEAAGAVPPVGPEPAAPPSSDVAQAVPTPPEAEPPAPGPVAAEAPAALPLAPSSPGVPAGPADLPEAPLDPMAALAALAPELATPSPPSAPPLRRAAGAAAPGAPSADPETRVVAAEDVNLRAGPSVGDDALRRLDAGDRVEVLGRERDWLRVRAPGGEEGWVREDFLRAP